VIGKNLARWVGQARRAISPVAEKITLTNEEATYGPVKDPERLNGVLNPGCNSQAGQLW
jgi:hypothetical protein